MLKTIPIVFLPQNESGNWESDGVRATAEDFVINPVLTNVTILYSQRSHGLAFPLSILRKPAEVNFFTPIWWPEGEIKEHHNDRIVSLAREIVTPTHGVAIIIPWGSYVQNLQLLQIEGN
jgi:hypothetical protein